DGEMFERLDCVDMHRQQLARSLAGFLRRLDRRVQSAAARAAFALVRGAGAVEPSPQQQPRSHDLAVSDGVALDQAPGEWLIADVVGRGDTVADIQLGLPCAVMRVRVYEAGDDGLVLELDDLCASRHLDRAILADGLNTFSIDDDDGILDRLAAVTVDQRSHLQNRGRLRPAEAEPDRYCENNRAQLSDRRHRFGWRALGWHGHEWSPLNFVL